jgi:hypothetical protein
MELNRSSEKRKNGSNLNWRLEQRKVTKKTVANFPFPKQPARKLDTYTDITNSVAVLYVEMTAVVANISSQSQTVKYINIYFQMVRSLK